MERFYDLASYIANRTRDYIEKTEQPSGAGCILVHFITLDKAFVKGYFNEECTEVSYPFPLKEGGSMTSSKTIEVDSQRPYYCGISSCTAEKTVYSNHFGLCIMLVGTELQTGNSHHDVNTKGASEISGFAEGYQFHKCITATISAKTTNRPLFKIVVAISTEHDDEMRSSEISRRTNESISSIEDYLGNVCGEYCTITFNR